MTRLRQLSASLSIFLLAAACGDDRPVVSDIPIGGDAGAGGMAGTDDGPPLATCPKGENPPSERRPENLGTISGHLVDEQGEPTSAGLVQICGKDICHNADVGSSGKLAYTVDETLDAPACKWGDGFDWAKLALPLGSGDTDLGTLTAVRLPDYADSPPLKAGTRVSSGGVTLTLAEDARVEIDALDYETPEQRGFRAAALSGQALEQLGQDFEIGFALSPLETQICPSPALRLDNLTSLEPGTELELYLLGLDVKEEWAPYGQWLKVGEGVVSDDGQTLDFPDGVPVLTAIGVKVKQ